MTDLAGKIAWVTGAGSGIGEATALRLATLGATVVVTGRRREPLESVVARMGGGSVEAADLTDAAAVDATVGRIMAAHGQIDILVSNAGMNLVEREWARLTPAAIDALFAGNLASAFYVARAVLPGMRANGGGVMVHTASMAGRNISLWAGPGYTAAKHAVVAMSHTINVEESGHGIRSTAFCPGEVNTPILDQRPQKMTAEQRAAMLQPDDCAALICFVAAMPAHACVNEVWLTPTANRAHAAQRART